MAERPWRILVEVIFGGPIYHRQDAGCRTLRRAKADGLESGTISREDAEQKGLHACTMCFPEDA
jgi:hypothetical protein